MKRKSERPPPSSPADRYQFPLQRRDTKPISVDHEERTQRRTAHLWNHDDSFGKDPSRDRHKERECRSFEDFRPADPIPRLNSSARPSESVRSARTSGGTADDAHRASSSKTSHHTPHDSIGGVSQSGEIMDAAGNTYPDLDQQKYAGSQWQDWATPVPSQAGHTDSQQQGSQPRSGTASLGHPSHGDSSLQELSLGEASNDSVESYHAALQELNSAKTNDGPGAKSSVKRWLRGQRRKPDLRLAELERAEFTGSPTWPASPAAMPNTPNHVSTFQPADEYRHLDSRSLTSQERAQRGDRKSRRVSIITEVDSRSSTRRSASLPKEHKRSFFGSIGSAFGSTPKTSPKYQSRQQAKGLEKRRDNWERRLSSYSHGSGKSSVKSGGEEEPFGHASPLGFTPNKSSRRGRTGYFSRQQRSSEGDDDAPVKGPYVGFSRRSEERESPPTPTMGRGILKAPAPSPPEQDGWLRTRRPRLNRSSSSAYSPGDTSARAMAKPAAYNAWKTHLDPQRNRDFRFNDTPNRPPLKHSKNPQLSFQDVPHEFNGPAHVPKSMQTPPISFRNRIPTPPIPKEPKEKGKYSWDSWLPRAADKDSEKTSTKDSIRGSDRASVNDQWYTPFPMPNEAAIGKAVNNPVTGDRDWYRIRMDKVNCGGDEPKDIEDLRMFEWDLPEHLPSSPLCPLHPKHPSKGNGVCVYHGRNKMGGVGTSKNAANGGLSPNDLGVALWK